MTAEARKISATEVTEAAKSVRKLAGALSRVPVKLFTAEPPSPPNTTHCLRCRAVHMESCSVIYGPPIATNSSRVGDDRWSVNDGATFQTGKLLKLPLDQKRGGNTAGKLKAWRGAWPRVTRSSTKKMDHTNSYCKTNRFDMIYCTVSLKR